MGWKIASSSSPSTALPLRGAVGRQLHDTSRHPNRSFLAPASNRILLAGGEHLLQSTSRRGGGGGGRSGIRSASTSTPEGMDEEDESDNPTGSSMRNQLDLLEQLASTRSLTSGYESDGNNRRLTIREQLSELVGGRGGEFTLPLGKRLKASMSSLTISQKRNIKRQAYLNEVSGRNDSVFFATIAAFVILPPVAILVVAVLTGYVELLP